MTCLLVWLKFTFCNLLTLFRSHKVWGHGTWAGRLQDHYNSGVSFASVRVRIVATSFTPLLLVCLCLLQGVLLPSWLNPATGQSMWEFTWARARKVSSNLTPDILNPHVNMMGGPSSPSAQQQQQQEGARMHVAAAGDGGATATIGGGGSCMETGGSGSTSIVSASEVVAAAAAAGGTGQQ
jgi:hypothetical protein